MPIKLCTNGHITGYRHCATCGTEKVRTVKGPSGRFPALGKKQKRAIDAAARKAELAARRGAA